VAEGGEDGAGVDAIPGAAAEPWPEQCADRVGGVRDPNEDEAIHVLEGELLVDVEGEQHRVGQGGLFFAPRGVAHAFMVTSETAHVLSVQTPGTGGPRGVHRRADWLACVVVEGLAPTGHGCGRSRSSPRASICSVPRRSPPRDRRRSPRRLWA
jgi:hypothetical protein